jgi:hypothetical protein
MDKKEYPSNFPDDVVNILNTLSFEPDNLVVAGSAGQRSALYAGDFDGFEIVELDKESPKDAVRTLKRGFQRIVDRVYRRKNLFISDIKCGAKPEWMVLNPKSYTDGVEVFGYNYKESKERFDSLPGLTPSEKREGERLLLPNPSPIEYLRAKDFFKFATVRWTAAEVLRGHKTLRDGSVFTLEAGLVSGMTKLDVVGLVEGTRYTDFSVIYEFQNKGVVLNPLSSNPIRDLAEDVFYYKTEGQFFKALKRKFSVLNLKGKTAEAEKLIPVFNSDLGRLYRIVNDIGSLLFLLENKESVPLRSVKFEIDQFIGRLSNVYTLNDYLKKEPRILDLVRKAVRSPRQQLIPELTKLMDELSDLLNAEAKKYI